MPRTYFQKKPDAEKRSVQMVVRWTPDEAQKVRHSAGIRHMDVAEFIRRAALGRKADVDYETEVVLALSAITREVRALHAAMVEHGLKPPEAELLPLILEARQAILRVAEVK
ncbi:plasmid mobilization protein [Cupriavidus pauculus]